MSTDEQLMANYATGDLAAFDELYRRYERRLYGFFLRSLRDPAQAEEMLQRTFLKLHTHKDKYMHGKSVQTWLFTIAANVRRDEWRRQYRLPPSAGEEEIERVAEQTGPPPRLSGEPTMADLLQQALARLPEPQRIVVQLHRYEQMTFEEIAQVLGIPAGAVRTRASRAYAVLRDELAPFAAQGVR